ncbi:DUF6271 family protein [Streptomyces sp. NPDC050617]|uniref:DUF6271 family protein n=1 Tax=Streptomyces sp. NPDC050617 TaxID=3154628 RepID=UPI0034163967
MNRPVPPPHDAAPGRPVTRLVYVPTNRPFAAAFQSVVAETVAFQESSPFWEGAVADVRLLVIDDCSPEVSRRNGEVAERAVREHGCDIHVLASDGWRRLADEIVATAALPLAEAAAARSALVKPSGSYGAGPNKAALVAAFTGAVSLHRRDSDQITGVDQRTGWSPLHVESRLLSPDATALPGTEAYCVGSSLTGEPTRDRRDLLYDSPDFARRIDDLSKPLPGTPRLSSRLAPVPARTVVGGGGGGGGGGGVGDGPGHGVQVDRDDTGLVEMGIAALRRVYEWIPEMPAVGVLGSDYFQKGLLYQLALPVFHHELRAQHVYEQWRAEQRDARHLGWYALAELRYSILRYHWNAFNEALKADREQLLRADGGFDSPAYGALFLDAARRGADRAARLPHEYVAVYKEAAATAAGEVRDRLDIRVAALETAVDAAPLEVAAAIEEFAGLVRLWPTLVSAAARIGQRYGRRLERLDQADGRGSPAAAGWIRPDEKG